LLIQLEVAHLPIVPPLDRFAIDGSQILAREEVVLVGRAADQDQDGQHANDRRPNVEESALLQLALAA
jgi:hypothetical protein